jgi:hypothetical protein
MLRVRLGSPKLLGSDNGWIGILVMPPLLQFFEELKTHPNLPYVPSGEGVTEIIPKELQ